MARLLAEADEPAFLQRSPALTVYAAALAGVVGGTLFLLSALGARLAASRLGRGARSDARPAALGTGAAIVLFAGLILRAGEPLAQRPPALRAVLLLLCASLALFCGWLVARLLARPGLAKGLDALWRPRIAALAAVAILAGALIAAQRAADGASADATPPALAGAPAPPAEARPHVLLVVVDTLRADALGCMGGRASTPTMDALAARGALVLDVVASSSWTLPSVASLFTSTPPWRHGCVDFDRRVESGLATLPEVFAASGWRTAAVIGNPFVSRERGFARGFQAFDAYAHELEGQLVANRLSRAALRVLGVLPDVERWPIPWLAPRAPFVETRLVNYTLDEDLNRRLFDLQPLSNEWPLFLYVQYVAPHTPYLDHPFDLLKDQPALAEENLVELRRRYDEEVAYVDRVLGELLQELERAGMLSNTIVAVTSDHGEEFLEHDGFEHGKSLFQEVVRVPLVVAGPGIPPGTRIHQRVRLLDLAPTLLELAGLEPPASFEGESFAASLRGGEEPDPRTAFLEASCRFLSPRERYLGAIAGRFKLVRRRDPSGELISEEVYDLEEDPRELRPLGFVPEDLEELARRLSELEAQARAEASVELDEETQRQMQALGYGE